MYIYYYVYIGLHQQFYFQNFSFFTKILLTVIRNCVIFTLESLMQILENNLFV